MEKVKPWEYESAEAWQNAYPVIRLRDERKTRLLAGSPACVGWAQAGAASKNACTVLCARFATNAEEHGVYGGLLHGRPCLHIRPISEEIKPEKTDPKAVRLLTEAERAGASAVCVMHEKRCVHMDGRPSPVLIPAPEALKDRACRQGDAWIRAIDWRLVAVLDFGVVDEMMGLLVWLAYSGGRYFVHAKCLIGTEYMNNVYIDLEKPWMLRDLAGRPGEVKGNAPGSPAEIAAEEEARAWLVGRMRQERLLRLVPGDITRHVELGPIQIGVQRYTEAHEILQGELRYYYGYGDKRTLVSGKLAAVHGAISYETDALGDYAEKPWKWLGHANRIGLWMPYDGIAPPDYDPGDTPGETTDPAPKPPPDPQPQPPDPPPDPDPVPPEDPPDDDGHGGYKYAGENGLIVTPSITGYRVTVDHAWIRAQLDATQVSVNVSGARSYAYDRGDQQIDVTNTMYYGGGGAGGRTVTINPAWSAPIWGETPDYVHTATHALEPGRVNSVRMNRTGIPRKQTVRIGWGVLARKDENGCVWLSLDPEAVRGIALDLTHTVVADGPVNCSVERGPWHININLTWQ